MLVYKFGGGVLGEADGIRRMVKIVRADATGTPARDLLLVVSALGKMTNAFENLWSDWIGGQDFSNSYTLIKEFHGSLAESLFEDISKARKTLEPVFADIDAVLQEKPPECENKAYDRIVCFGEILSSKLISAYFHSQKMENTLLDSRDLIRTDSCFRNAKVDWPYTETHVKEKCCVDKLEGQEGVESGILWLTQGFIGSDLKGNNTTLGREGSDFSAAIFAYVLNADQVVFWKDVPGVMTADPADFKDVRRLDQISYLEAIELSYFGAKILHPNTIKPLQNKRIPLRIMPIQDRGSRGTSVIDKPLISDELPVLIIKPDQVLLSIQPRDFSFIMEEALSRVFSILAKYRIRVNLLQHGAVSLSLCVDYKEDQLNSLVGELVSEFKVLYNTGLDLLTIRHYSQEVIEKYTNGRIIYVQQQSRKTARFVLS